MATHYLYATILTDEAVAANNRGDNIGNTPTLQKVFHQDDLHTTVSAESIRFALRYRFQLELEDERINRTYNMATGKVKFKDDKWKDWTPNENVFVDDDLMGFMNAAAAKKEQEAEEVKDDSAEVKDPPTKGKKTKPKGTTYKRPSPLATGRAVSLRPYRGETSFNCATQKEDGSGLTLYNAEIHCTEYQYFFGLNLSSVINKENIKHLINSVVDPPPVAGNHARFAYDFSPASIVLRVTNAHSSRIQNCFEHDEDNRTFSVKRLIERVEVNDVPANELIIGGDLADTDDGKRLAELGATVIPGVVKAAAEARRRIAKLGDEYEPLASNNEELG